MTGAKKTSITLPAKWECDQTEVSASILNISDGGMCLLISQMRNVGDRIRLTLFDEDMKPAYILLTACWQIDSDDGHVSGCEFNDRAAYLRLKHIVDLQAAKAAAGSPLLPRVCRQVPIPARGLPPDEIQRVGRGLSANASTGDREGATSAAIDRIRSDSPL